MGGSVTVRRRGLCASENAGMSNVWEVRILPAV